jgi:hypothetical protein
MGKQYERVEGVLWDKGRKTRDEGACKIDR